jgi:hypothetical protein
MAEYHFTSTHNAPFKSEVIVTTHDDKRLAAKTDDPCRYEQAFDGPTYLAIRRTATDEQLGRAATRLGVPLGKLKEFRETAAK